MAFNDNTATIVPGQGYDNFLQKNENMTLTGTSLATGHLVLGPIEIFDKKQGSIQIVNENAAQTVTGQIFCTTNPDAESYADDDTDWVPYAPAKTCAVSSPLSFEFYTRMARICFVAYVNGSTDSDVSFFANVESNRRR